MDELGSQFVTPEKGGSTDYMSGSKLSNPETFFTPLKVPCSTRNDTLEKSKCWSGDNGCFIERILFKT
jgi:hypothetical protein